MESIEFDYTNFDVIEEYKLSEHTGSYRIIRYDTGYYALQSLIDANNLVNPTDEERYVTIVVSPIKDKIIQYENKGIDLSIAYGSLVIHSLMDCICDADNSRQGNNWNLNLYLDDEGSEVFTEVITRGDGETLIEQLKDFQSFQREQSEKFLESYPMIQKIEKLMYISVLALIFLIILFVIFKGVGLLG